jgi:putative hemolysin
MKKELIEKEDISKLLKITNLTADILASFIMKVLRYDAFNQLYQEAYSDQPLAFIDKVLELLQIEVKFNAEALEKLPIETAFLTISNHPYGGIDGIILLKIFKAKFPNYKILANFLLQKIDPLKDCFIEVNPFEQATAEKSNRSGVRKAIEHVNKCEPLGTFPAGEVSTYKGQKIQDKEWETNSLKLMKKLKVPIVPVYFKGSNSNLFHLLGMVAPKARTAKLPSELLNKRNKTIEVRIGNPISVSEQESFDDINQYGRFLRLKTYSLGSSLEVKRFFNYSLKRKKKAENIISETPKQLVANEINQLKGDEYLFDSSNYSVYCAPAKLIPNTLREIGRLREKTYRAIGEGTNKELDTDEFDLYYYHLIIWDKLEEKIVGGYRIGCGEDIISRYGKKGFYINQLFKFSSKFKPILKQSVDLGRSYITEEYQKKPLPLFLLWKGIFFFILKNGQYRYLTGPVSISNEYSTFSKSLIIQFLKKNYYHPTLGDLVKPRNDFKVKIKPKELEDIIELTSDDLQKLDQFIADIEPRHLKIPVLFKKYLKQNAKVLCFNVDPKFSDALDGLMLLDIYQVPDDMVKGLLKEFNAENLYESYLIRKEEVLQQ